MKFFRTPTPHRKKEKLWRYCTFRPPPPAPPKNVGNYRKYDIFFNFRFMENMIFPSSAENHENMIFTFFMQWCDCYMSKNLLGPNREQSGNKKQEGNNKKWPVFDHRWQGTDVKPMWKRSVRTISVCFFCSKRYWWTCKT